MAFPLLQFCHFLRRADSYANERALLLHAIALQHWYVTYGAPIASPLQSSIVKKRVINISSCVQTAACVLAL